MVAGRTVFWQARCCCVWLAVGLPETDVGRETESETRTDCIAGQSALTRAVTLSILWSSLLVAATTLSKHNCAGADKEWRRKDGQATERLVSRLIVSVVLNF